MGVEKSVPTQIAEQFTKSLSKNGIFELMPPFRENNTFPKNRSNKGKKTTYYFPSRKKSLLFKNSFLVELVKMCFFDLKSLGTISEIIVPNLKKILNYINTGLLKFQRIASPQKPKHNFDAGNRHHLAHAKTFLTYTACVKVLFRVLAHVENRNSIVNPWAKTRNTTLTHAVLQKFTSCLRVKFSFLSEDNGIQS
ncbi:hypothetical protein BpHYR1_033333 [Brachionus plicatilis]|uniref:Uncharacterized protein n=1 Tax=Brachionus plicatilis TaxID=10195 RepID=A0A3M7QKR5_BRAPC|nr:hypothetical protein BpHYR1_033333 [Brachionus plicatilis]